MTLLPRNWLLLRENRKQVRENEALRKQKERTLQRHKIRRAKATKKHGPPQFSLTVNLGKRAPGRQRRPVLDPVAPAE